jgi:AraC-like DNA-binding protein
VRFEAGIREVDEVLECHLVSGGYDYLLRFLTRGVNHYQEVIEELLERNIGIEVLQLHRHQVAVHQDALPDRAAGVLRHIDENLNQPLTLSELAGLAGLSIWRFATVFRQQVGISPHRYICRLRVQRAQALIRTACRSPRAASEAGFYDQSHLSRHFKMVFGMTPGQYLTTAGQPRTAC